MKQPTNLAPECRLGQLATAFWIKRTGKAPDGMHIKGDGSIVIWWRENLPDHTQEAHFTDDTGQKYDAGNYSVPIIELANGSLT